MRKIELHIISTNSKLLVFLHRYTLVKRSDNILYTNITVNLMKVNPIDKNGKSFVDSSIKRAYNPPNEKWPSRDHQLLVPIPKFRRTGGKMRPRHWIHWFCLQLQSNLIKKSYFNFLNFSATVPGVSRVFPPVKSTLKVKSEGKPTQWKREGFLFWRNLLSSLGTPSAFWACCAQWLP